MLTGMPLERKVRRYTAYFRGWCQAFGEHDLVAPQDEGINWLLGKKQIGLILPGALTRSLYREVLGKQRPSPLLDINAERVQVGGFRQVLPQIWREQGLKVFTELMQADKDLHLYLTYHFVYPSGTRIVTLSQRKPLSIIYKEVKPMDIRLVE